jgi:hypothetical protein
LGINGTLWGYGTNDVYDFSGPTVFFFGTTDTTSTRIVADAVLSPKEAYAIDNKHDDGLPHKGKILADHGDDVGNSNQCLDYTKNAGQYDAPGDDGRAYVLTNTVPKCRMMFVFR